MLVTVEFFFLFLFFPFSSVCLIFVGDEGPESTLLCFGESVLFSDGEGRGRGTQKEKESEK